MTCNEPMSDTHVIRLRGPWDYEPLARLSIAADGTRRETTDELPPAGRIHLPADWGATLGDGFRGRVRYTRRFGLPTNLESNQQVCLVIDGVDYFGTLTLNGHPLGEVVGYQKPREFEVRPLLMDRNLLTLDVELPEVKIEDEKPAKAGRREGQVSAIARPGREDLPGGPIGEIRLEIRSLQ